MAAAGCRASHSTRIVLPPSPAVHLRYEYRGELPDSRLLAGWGILRGRLRLVRVLGSVQCVDHLAGTRVVQAFAGFALNGIGIALQVLHVLFEVVVLLLQRFDLLVKLAILGTLLLISIQTVAAHDHVVSENESQHHGQAGRDATPHPIEGVHRPRLQPDFRFAGVHGKSSPAALQKKLPQRLMIGAISPEVVLRVAKTRLEESTPAPMGLTDGPMVRTNRSSAMTHPRSIQIAD